MTNAVPQASGGASLLRALWRLGTSVLHALGGVLICAVVFPFIDEPAQMRHVGRWSRRLLELMGIGVRVSGEIHAAPVLLLANHVSWLDVLALNAARPTRFVAKAAIGRWPLIGFLVARGGTLFIEHERKRDALRVVHQIAAALRVDVSIAVFPEGTTGAGRRLLPFHANLLQAAIATAAPVQPVALRYADRSSAFSAAVEWIGQTSLAGSVWRIACADALEVHVSLLPAIATVAAERRGLAAAVQAQIQAALDAAHEIVSNAL